MQVGSLKHEAGGRSQLGWERNERGQGGGSSQNTLYLVNGQKTKNKFRKKKGKFESKAVRASNWRVMKSPPLGLFVRVTAEVFDFAL